MPELITLSDIYAARERIRGTAVYTPLIPLNPERLAAAAHRAGVALPASARLPILLKNEAAQPIGSFKLRGAFNKIARLAESDPAALRRGVITYSSGNHAQGVAFAARAVGTKAVIVMPNNAPEVKRAATAALGAEIVTVGPASSERRLRAEALVAAHGYLMVPPYDDPDIIAGQATCGLEIFEQLRAGAPGIPGAVGSTLVLAPVSGGGLLSGVSAGVKLASEAAGLVPPQVWGCEPQLAADAHASFYSRSRVEWTAAETTRTLADGLRTQSLGERNFEHILRFVDGVVTVSESELRMATRLILAATDLVAEPSGAVTLAAALFHQHELPLLALNAAADRAPAIDRMVAVVSGGNLEPALRATLEAENNGVPAHV